MKDRINEIISKMTLEEKASLCSGKDFWHLKGVERLGIPEIMVTDGPHGLRKQAGDSDHLGINNSVPSTCFPTAVTSASSWDSQLLYEMGEAIGEECCQEEVAVVLGPGVNMKRSPLCGRNFEYFSEDPYLAGEMGAAWVQGVQSKGVGTSLKHFAANNQEKARLVGNSIIDERALREIYLTGFEKVVKQAQPWTVMCAYNRINGIYASEHQELLTETLRNQWGFNGIVMTDWGAMNDRVKGLLAGLDLEMPGPCGANDRRICESIRKGELQESVLDETVKRILELIVKADDKRDRPSYDKAAHHNLARKIAAKSMVLLKNEEGILPLQIGSKYAVIGAFAEKPRYQGAGSSKINPYQIDSILDALNETGASYEYAQGYDLEQDDVNRKLVSEACECAKDKAGVVVLAGLPDSYESEGYDREHLNLPESHNYLIEELLKVNSNVVVVLLCGSPVLMPWKDKVKGILLAYLGGQAVGGGCADVLYGKVNPSGHLAETFPLSLEDTPCYQYFAKEEKDVQYRESILIGYRYYDWAGKEVAFPFGYGLSYTTFAYGDLHVAWNHEEKKGSVTVSVANTGKMQGEEVVQIYIGKKDSKVMRAPKELKGFKKISLNPGESKTITMDLDERSFAYYDVIEKKWKIEEGIYDIYAAASSRDIRLQAEVSVKGEICEESYRYIPDQAVRHGKFSVEQEEFEKIYGGELPLSKAECKFHINSTIGEVLATETGKGIFGGIVTELSNTFKDRMMQAMFKDMPLRGLGMLSGGAVDRDEIDEMIEQANQS